MNKEKRKKTNTLCDNDSDCLLSIRPMESYISTSIGKLKYNQWASLTKEQKKSVKILSDNIYNKDYFILKDIKSVGLKQTFIIYLNDGYSLVCTEDTKLKAIRDGKIIECDVKNLKEKDYLLRSYKKDYLLFPRDIKNDNIDYWYLLGCILNGFVYTTKNNFLACKITNKNKEVLKKIELILKSKSIKYFYKKHTIYFDATCFSKEINNLNIRIDREVSFDISLFDSGLFLFNKQLTENNVKSFLTSFLDFCKIDNYNNYPKIRLFLRCDKLAREIQSLFNTVGVPAKLEQIFCTRKCFLSEKEIINENLNTSIYFTQLMAIHNLFGFDITNIKIKEFLKHKHKTFYTSNCWNQDIPIFNKDGVVNIDENLKNYCQKNNIEPNKIQKSLINTGMFHTTFLEFFKPKNIKYFEDELLDYIYENQTLKTKIIKITNGDVVECGGIVIRGNTSNITNINDSIVSFVHKK